MVKDANMISDMIPYSKIALKIHSSSGASLPVTIIIYDPRYSPDIVLFLTPGVALFLTPHVALCLTPVIALFLSPNVALFLTPGVALLLTPHVALFLTSDSGYSP